MPLARPYASADDATVVDGCRRGDEDAWAALRSRLGALVHATVLRATDGPRASELDVEATLELVWDELRGPLRSWNGESQLRSFIALSARHLALTHGEASTSPSVLIAAAPTPSGLFLDDLLAVEPAARVEEAIEKLPPNIGALIRLRLRGLSRDDVAATLGMSPATVRANLERVAKRLADLDEADTEATWRALLDAAEIEERVGRALRTEDDPDYRSLRALVEKTRRAVSAPALGRPWPRTEGCLDDATTAAFVDGTLRGPSRARAEGHVATCPRCVDEAAALVGDLRVQPTLRDAGELDTAIAVTAACIATGHFAAAERMATRAMERGGSRVTGELRRIAQACRLLDGAPPRAEQTSQVVATHATVDDGPLIALESLVLSDAPAAWRAIDDDTAKQTLGARLRLLAAAAGWDLDAARALAEAALAQPSLDPGHACDARAVAALPRARALPREVLIERLRSLVPAAVRSLLARA